MTDEHVTVRRARMWKVYWGDKFIGAASSRKAADAMAKAAREITNHEPPPVPPKKPTKVVAKKGAITKTMQKRMKPNAKRSE